MDDLAGLDWNQSNNKQQAKPSAPAGRNYFPSLRPTPPVSGRSTPAAPLNLPKPATPQSNANTGPSKDSFANLFQSSSTANANKNLSLAEQQKRLQQQKARQLGATGGAGASDDAWAKLGGANVTGTSTPGTFNLPKPPSAQSTGLSGVTRPGRAPSPKAPQSLTKEKEDEDDLLAAFKAEAPVDKSSHFPAAMSASSSARATPAPMQSGSNMFGSMPDDDDDPFGLGTSNIASSYKPTPAQTTTFGDDDDILGDLGKPVSELPRKREPAIASQAAMRESTRPSEDRAVAELVDMGFPAEKAQEALEATGGQVQSAVSWLLTQAHSEARNKSRTPTTEDRESRRPVEREGSQRREGRSPANGDKDSTQVASELGASLWKGANSLWKTGKKQISKAVQEFNETGDSSQPKWLRESSASRPSSTTGRAPRQEKPTIDSGVTDEAMMLDSHDARPAPRSRRQDTGSGTASSSRDTSRPSRDQSPALPSRPAANPQPRPAANPQSRPAWQQQAPPNRSKLSRQAVEEETATAYISPARRKKATPKPEPEPDLLNGTPAPVRSGPSKPRPSNLRSQTQSPAASSLPPAPVRPVAKTRAVPSVSPIAMKSCNQHRSSGTAAFKRGDYGAAAESYSSAISALPGSHPLIILLYTNRATTRVKTGDSKGALSDAEAAIQLIGPTRGASEAIDVPAEDGNGSSSKEMSPFWGKAMMRRAEALENMERWSEAGNAWRDCVEGGVGGALSIQGRNRCDQAIGKAAAPKPAAAARKAPPKAAVPRRPAVNRAPESFEAVNKMREANKAAEAVEEEKFRLADTVDERINTWRKGKEANLRALLGSLDTVLWTDSGWKKVGMSELLVPNKVKIAYMKGIGKVHPDKLPTTATTEQQMISAAVFSTLNEAWDKFKTENGL